MSSKKLTVSLADERPVAEVTPKQLVEQYSDPTILAFEKWFSQPTVSGSGLLRGEKEVLRAFIFYMTKVPDEVAVSG